MGRSLGYREKHDCHYEIVCVESSDHGFRRRLVLLGRYLILLDRSLGNLLRRIFVCWYAMARHSDGCLR